MTSAVQTLSTVMATDMNYYAGDPDLLKPNTYADRIDVILNSDRADQLTARVAIHAQLREAFKSAQIQACLKPFLVAGENLDTYVRDGKARAKFFSKKQQTLKAAIMSSEAQKNLKDAHGELAAWENENAVLLRHQMFMTYMPSQALLLESAATVALYRQYATLEEGEYTSESSDGEVPQMLRKMGGKDKPYFTQSEKPFSVDEHNKMFSQQVLQNKRVEYEQMREKVANLRDELEDCDSVKKLADFIGIRNDIYREFGIDRLASLCNRKDKELADPNMGGVDNSIRGLPADNEYAMSCRVAQYSLPKIIEACHKNYLNIIAVDDWDAMMNKTGHSARDIINKVKVLKDAEVFRYWFLSCITADCPQVGPNKIVGKNVVSADDYRRFFLPQKSTYVPSLNGSNRTNFGTKVADARCLPHIVVLSPVTYSYRENNDPNAVKTCTLDMVVYDMTNEKVLLIVTNSTDDRKPRGAFLNAHEERYRFATVVRAAITYENEYHGFQCSGTIAEYLFNPQEEPEENYYCVMAPGRVYQKVPVDVDVPVKAFRPFTACPPRYFVLGANWGVAAGVAQNPYPASFSHMQLNEDAIALCDIIPAGVVDQSVLPQLLNYEDGMAQLEAEKKKKDAEEPSQQQSPRASARTPRGTTTPRGGATRAAVVNDLNDPTEILAREKHQGPGEEIDPLSPYVPKDVLEPVRNELLKSKRQWPAPTFIKAREANSELKQLLAVKDGKIRTPLNVFTEMMKLHAPADENGDADYPTEDPAPRSAQGVNHKNAARQAANVAWF